MSKSFPQTFVHETRNGGWSAGCGLCGTRTMFSQSFAEAAQWAAIHTASSTHGREIDTRRTIERMAKAMESHDHA